MLKANWSLATLVPIVMMSIMGSEPHGRLEVLAAVKGSFSPIGQGDCRPQIGQQIKFKSFGG